jgi:hypothetical protein
VFPVSDVNTQACGAVFTHKQGTRNLGGCGSIRFQSPLNAFQIGAHLRGTLTTKLTISLQRVLNEPHE